MTNLYDGLISDHWPHPDPEIKAFAYALQQAVKSVVQYADKSMCVAGLDNLEEDILDELAVENRAINYSQDYAIEAKRNVIRSILGVYQNAGTAAAVRQFIQDVYDESTVEEWYEYGGTPGHFRISITGLYTDEKAALIREAINKLKKYSAILDAVNFNGGESEGTLGAFAGTIDYTITYTSVSYE